MINNNFYESVKNILEEARTKAYSSINSYMLKAYWNIGRMIVEEQSGTDRAEYGQYILKELSKKLTKDYGKGFDYSNLTRMRKLYLSFTNIDALRQQLSWTHYRLLMKVEDATKRDFYIAECIKSNWSTRQLERQINSFYYERLLSSQDKNLVRSEILETEIGLKSNDIIKDPYVLEFLDLKENINFLEKDLEQGLMNNLQEFLLELGKGFAFVARQKRITADGDHFYIDLVFYNYLLKCFVLIDLKIGKLTHENIGQMDFYVRYYEKEVKGDDDNPTIGIILCSEKNETIVKYSILEESKQIFASKYMLYMPTEEELKREINKDREILEIEERMHKDE
ncbi:PDDEXK nuclease domain-containing protein [Clostridium tagluense]|nr:PDDEXK nuclease domain-containing protein [Clostridium tagluense]MCB2313647.1 PDDEXK nuclease domain-containing protein [Clostridium tagluense]MCB2318105.1 PDDEXK nuclease domain-containing protein [Clostridium tagluense]MCB2323959.1 PDDEXK nuclease domain-containing protein [Clostridium tagluense]MCB2327889.1 PDDEXK nuclease domain-containing protein [Clostridium tagluense]